MKKGDIIKHKVSKKFYRIKEVRRDLIFCEDIFGQNITHISLKKKEVEKVLYVTLRIPSRIIDNILTGKTKHIINKLTKRWLEVYVNRPSVIILHNIQTKRKIAVTASIIQKNKTYFLRTTRDEISIYIDEILETQCE